MGHRVSPDERSAEYRAPLLGGSLARGGSCFSGGKRSATHDRPPSEAVVVAVTNARLDFGTWKQIF